jgi:hypothetical protein
MDVFPRASVITSREKMKFLCRAVLAILICLVYAQAQSATEPETIAVKLADGTAYRVAGFVTLIDRLESGRWPDTSPAAMNALAERLSKETLLKLGVPKFFDSNPPMPLRNWDKSDWGSYRPK